MDSANFDHDAWLTTREAADLIGCGERNVLRLIKSGDIDAHKDGHSYGVSLKSTRAYKQSEANQKGKGRANGEGSVFEYPEGSGKWYVVLTIKVGGRSKRIKRSAKSQKDAIKLKKELEYEFGQNKAASGEIEQEKPPIELPMVKELCAEWLESISQANKENTLLGYKKALQRWVLPSIGDQRVDEPTTPSVQELFNNLAKRYSSNTVHRAHTPLKMAFDYAVDVRGYIPKNVVAQVNLPKARTKSPGIRLKIKELQAILRVADEGSQRVLIYCLVILGTRLGEGMGGYTKDFDSEEHTITINQQLQALGGSRLKIETPKTPSGIRLLPVPRRLSALLHEQISNTGLQRELVEGQSRDTNLIFQSEDGTALWPRNVERRFASIVDQAGLAQIYPAPPRPKSPAVEASTGTAKKSKYKPKTCAVCPQDLRRTVLTLLGDLGVDDATKALIAGHGPKNVTMHYDRGSIERMRAALQKLEDLILGEEE